MPMRNDILVVEISGKRAGTYSQRPTERFNIKYDHLIISNNSEGYVTDWDIINVPEDYVEWYKANFKTSDTAWYAPMNRSYAIKYAREKGYKYLVQLDDNIVFLEISSMVKHGEVTKRYCARHAEDIMNDYIDMLVCVLEHTNAGMAGCNLAGTAMPSGDFLKERYCYSFFALKLDVCPDVFQGDFEDDIEFRLKLGQMGIPAVQVACLRYSKKGQVTSKDETGNRAAYTSAGVKRGEHMRRLYGDKYKCGMRSHLNSTHSRVRYGEAHFKHILAPWKVGIVVYDRKAIDDKMAEIFERNQEHRDDYYVMKTRKGKHGG